MKPTLKAAIVALIIVGMTAAQAEILIGANTTSAVGNTPVGATGAPPVNAVGTTPFNPAGAAPFNPAGGTPGMNLSPVNPQSGAAAVPNFPGTTGGRNCTPSAAGVTASAPITCD